MRPGQTSWPDRRRQGGHLYGAQDERIFVDYDNARLAELVFRVRFDGFSY